MFAKDTSFFRFIQFLTHFEGQKYCTRIRGTTYNCNQTIRVAKMYNFFMFCNFHIMEINQLIIRKAFIQRVILYFFILKSPCDIKTELNYLIWYSINILCNKQVYCNIHNRTALKLLKLYVELIYSSIEYGNMTN